MQSAYRDQVDLLLEVLTPILADSRLALKGGTAINLFVMDMPRLSVDIDVTFTEINSREEFIESIHDVFLGFKQRLKRYKLEIFKTSEGIPKQARISNGRAEIKIDANLILRGTVFPTIEHNLCLKACIEFERNIVARCVSFEDLYAGKFCAALDRQHPRDLYDVKLFFENFEFSESLRKSFLVYLISCGRPIHEIIKPNLLDQRKLFEQELQGMTKERLAYEDLEQARALLIKTVMNQLTNEDRKFLLSVNIGEPKWELLGIVNMENMPGVKWKILNIKKMSPIKRIEDVECLKKKLGL